ncbi:MAG: hypothetical protein JST51_01115 [Armatimonadetes bacterium]|nr:hypothetical protein [Armatimonadota bacterium]
MSLQVTRWTVDYGNGTIKEVRVPHAWRQDVDVRWEGPAIYKTLIDVPVRPTKLRFNGVSYACKVLINGKQVAFHEGVWDAFEVVLTPFRGKRVELEVQVIKNGGATYPVKKTLAGFLPYVYHTFGGIFRPVEIVDEAEPLTKMPGERAPFEDYMRGILHWGWYPEIGHCHPGAEQIAEELDYVQSLGFNTVKFCLWLPPHQYIEEMHARGMHAWIELPLWMPDACLFDSPSTEVELDAIVRQYAHHPNVVAWTLGCEFGSAPAEFREKWVKKLQALTRCQLIKDNSGGAEMYGGDPREYGTFYDFHPYGDAQFFPSLLDSLSTGPREKEKSFLGETMDHDVHRDIEQIGETMPFWASALAELNDQGVRWQYDMPKFISENRFVNEAKVSRHKELMASSVDKALFVRKHLVEQLRSKGDFNGYVLTGLRDTPISSSGILTDWARKRYTPDQFTTWNSDQVLFLIPARNPRWIRGGNRMGYSDLYNVFADRPTLIRIGYAGSATTGSAIWTLKTLNGKPIQEGIAEPTSAEGEPIQIASVFLDSLAPGSYLFHCEFGGAQNTWEIHAHYSLTFEDCSLLVSDDRMNDVKFGKDGVPIALGWRDFLRERVGQPMIVLVDGQGGLPMPYWRECITQGFGLSWEERLAVCPDQVLDPEWLARLSDVEVLETRIDTRTYVETAYTVRVGDTILTTYRPYGGLGTQPNGLSINPAGQTLLRRLVDLIHPVF